MSSIKETIGSFIKAHAPADRLVVCTGYVSVKGLAWLARQVPANRAVTIIIGDMRRNNLAKANDEDRRVAEQFLRQGNVEVYTWYRTYPVKKMAHGKAVAAIHNGRVVAALVGSANLTEKGLSDNLEIMVPCDAQGLPSVQDYIDTASSHESAKAKLIDAVSGQQSSTSVHRRVPRRTHRRPAVGSRRRRSRSVRQPTKAGGGGCAPALLTLPFRTIARLFSPARSPNRDQSDR